jgi:phytoene dehydrogenase-like protein
VWTGLGFERVADPLRRPGAVLSTLTADIGGIADKLRVAQLQLRLRRTDPVQLLRAPDRTTAQALDAAGFSPHMVRRFFRPLVGGIQLDLDLSTSARMFDVIFRTLAVGDAAVPALGMQAIPDQLAAGLPEGTVALEHAVERLDGTAAVLGDGTRVEGRAVVVATEGPRAASLVGVRDPGSKRVAALWFTAPEPPVRGRAIVLDGEGGGPVANLAVHSEVAPSYAPPGRHLFVAACPGETGDDLETAARVQMKRWFGHQVDSWELLRHDVILHGQPLAGVPFSPKRRVALGDGRYVAGDHRDTPSIQGAMFSGRRCAEAVLADLAAS